jgi:hypothetical protein
MPEEIVSCAQAADESAPTWTSMFMNNPEADSSVYFSWKGKQCLHQIFYACLRIELHKKASVADNISLGIYLRWIVPRNLFAARHGLVRRSCYYGLITGNGELPPWLSPQKVGASCDRRLIFIFLCVSAQVC